jgi:hypothetical protein
MQAEEPGEPSQPPWANLSDEELLKVRICDLGVRIEGTEVEARIADLNREIESRGLPLKPGFYLGDEWFSPEGKALIAIPFYLAHPRLKALEQKLMLEVEGGSADWCLQLLRHETGHVYDHVYHFSQNEDWRELFGNPEVEYAPDYYRPKPYSKSFVRNLPNWYAQSHPHEDFAETFAVWLSMPAEKWQARYRGWPAIRKLEYLERVLRNLPPERPKLPRANRIYEASRLRRTLGQYYEAKRKLFAEDFPDFYDADLRSIFSPSGNTTDSAAAALRRLRTPLVTAITRWTGQPKYTVLALVNRLVERCEQLELPAPRDEARTSFELAAYLAATLTNQLYTGRLRRPV